MKKKLTTSTLGLLAVLALVSACGKTSKPGAGGGNGINSSPISGPGVSAEVSNLYNQLDAISMGQYLAVNNVVVRRDYTYNNNATSNTYSILNGLLQFSFNMNTSSNYSLVGSPQSSFVVQIPDGANVLTNNGMVTKAQVMNRMFRPDLGMLDNGDCNGTKAIVNATVRAPTNPSIRIVDFTISESCAGSTVMHLVSNTIDLNYPLIANPKESIQGKYQQQNSSSFTFVPKKARTFGPF